MSENKKIETNGMNELDSELGNVSGGSMASWAVKKGVNAAQDYFADKAQTQEDKDDLAQWSKLSKKLAKKFL